MQGNGKARPFTANVVYRDGLHATLEAMIEDGLQSPDVVAASVRLVRTDRGKLIATEQTAFLEPGQAARAAGRTVYPAYDPSDFRGDAIREHAMISHGLVMLQKRTEAMLREHGEAFICGRGGARSATLTLFRDGILTVTDRMIERLVAVDGVLVDASFHIRGDGQAWGRHATLDRAARAKTCIAIAGAITGTGFPWKSSSANYFLFEEPRAGLASYADPD